MVSIKVKYKRSELKHIPIYGKNNFVINGIYHHLSGVNVCDKCKIHSLNIYECILGFKHCVSCKIKYQSWLERSKLGMSGAEYAKYRADVEFAHNTDNGINQNKFGVAFNE